MTYRALAERANRYARWALAQDLGKGETVCLMMPNRPEYMAIWLGITSVGGVVALLNTNLRGRVARPLPRHRRAEAHHRRGRAVRRSPRRARAPRRAGRKSGRTASDDVCRASIATIDAFPADRLTTAERRGVTLADRALYIYTSGTTGLPKAANVSHHRLMHWSYWFAGMMDTGPTTGCTTACRCITASAASWRPARCWSRGGSVVIREKFSAARLLGRHRRLRLHPVPVYRRALPLSGQRAADSRARRSIACACAAATGCAPTSGQTFQDRFAIPQILEFYAATEGNFSLYNVEGKAGAIGRIPSFLAHRFPLALVKFDADDRRARRATRRLLHALRDRRSRRGDRQDRRRGDMPAARSRATPTPRRPRRKILRDVFEPGDAWFRTGDLMRTDASGFFYFVDRIGDTFRWKGENVSTSEVAEAITAFPGVIEATVYGVAVPGTEGAAGMAALVVDGAFDLAALRSHLARGLPAYARPLFLRIQDRIEVTATFKHKKTDLVREGLFQLASSSFGSYISYYPCRIGQRRCFPCCPCPRTIRRGRRLHP